MREPRARPPREGLTCGSLSLDTAIRPCREARLVTVSVYPAGPESDFGVALHLITPRREGNGLDTLAVRYIGAKLPYRCIALASFALFPSATHSGWPLSAVAPSAGLYLYHCHILGHEDLGMMRNYCVEVKR